LGDYGINDKNLPSNNRNLQKLIKHLNDYSEVGLHPSFGSNNNPDRVRKEVSRLSQITHREVKSSRQHFSRLHFPSTYKTLVENGITSDYSMGYHNQIGFRASISTPFFWYDIDSETETNLLIYPYTFSESLFRFTLKLSPEEALIKITELIQEFRITKGTFVSMFHNESLGDYGIWKGWKSLYEKVIKIAL
jgi:hypothetical protein